jgi:CubicO group peptidase (beta-lactamase class C family)
LRSRRLLSSSAAILCLTACGRTQADSRTARVDALFEKWNRTDAPGCAVGISRNGSVLYEHGYGMANLEWGIPITPETVFPIASISKSFTAMSVLLAARRGQLSLDDEVQKYVPEWKDRDDHITIRHLVAHTSGVRDAFTLFGWGAHGESADPNESIALLLARQRGLNFTPGSEYEYNNGGYALLATIVKRATGQSLHEYADANIFKPLGMSHSFYQRDAAMLIPHRASGYTRETTGWHAAREYIVNVAPPVVGNAGVYSTVRDLLRWEQNFDDVRVGTPEMFAAMQKPLTLAGGKTSTYGLGLGLGEYRKLPTVEHSGGDRGMATKVARFPSQRFAVAVLCNEDNIVMGGMARVNPDVFTNGIADIYLADALAPADTAAPESKAAPAPSSVNVSEAELSVTAGLYRDVSRDFPVLFTVGHGSLMARAYYADDFDFELTPVGGNRFMFQERVPFEFSPAASGRPKQWHYGPGNNQTALQAVTFAPPAVEVRAYGGEYRSDELGVTVTLEPRDSTLVVKNVGFPDVTIAPFLKDVFVGDSVGIVKFSRDARGVVTEFTLNRLVARGVRFERIKRA